jgi:hypothetical protein
MASVALLFQHRFSKVLIAATNSYAELTPWGTHQLLDPLWSTELMEFEHDGARRHGLRRRSTSLSTTLPCGGCAYASRTRTVPTTADAA